MKQNIQSLTTLYENIFKQIKSITQRIKHYSTKIKNITHNEIKNKTYENINDSEAHHQI